MLAHALRERAHAQPRAPERLVRGLARAETVIAFADFVTPELAEHETVVFPAESNGV